MTTAASEQKAMIGGIFTVLLANADFTNNFGGSGAACRLFEQMAVDEPQVSILPLCILTVISDPDIPFFNRTTDMAAEVQFDIYGSRRDGSAALMDLEAILYAALQGSSITMTGYGTGTAQRLSRPSFSREGDALKCTVTYRIFGTDQR